MATHPEKNVRCHTNVKHTARPVKNKTPLRILQLMEHVICHIEKLHLPEYMQNICTDGNGENMPIKNDSMSVTEVMVMETAASDNMIAMRSGTGSLGDALLQAASITNVSSIPIPEMSMIRFKIIEDIFKVAIQINTGTTKLTNHQEGSS